MQAAWACRKTELASKQTRACFQAAPAARRREPASDAAPRSLGVLASRREPPASLLRHGSALSPRRALAALRPCPAQAEPARLLLASSFSRPKPAPKPLPLGCRAAAAALTHRCGFNVEAWLAPRARRGGAAAAAQVPQRRAAGRSPQDARRALALVAGRAAARPRRRQDGGRGAPRGAIFSARDEGRLCRRCRTAVGASKLRVELGLVALALGTSTSGQRSGQHAVPGSPTCAPPTRV